MSSTAPHHQKTSPSPVRPRSCCTALLHDCTHHCESTLLHILSRIVPFEHFTEQCGSISDCQIQEIKNGVLLHFPFKSLQITWSYHYLFTWLHVLA